jgi:hypothetical protein
MELTITLRGPCTPTAMKSPGISATRVPASASRTIRSGVQDE